MLFLGMHYEYIIRWEGGETNCGRGRETCVCDDLLAIQIKLGMRENNGSQYALRGMCFKLEMDWI